MLQIYLIGRESLLYHAVFGPCIDDIMELSVEIQDLVYVILESIEFHEFYGLSEFIDILGRHTLYCPFNCLYLEECPQIEKIGYTDDFGYPALRKICLPADADSVELTLWPIEG